LSHRTPGALMRRNYELQLSWLLLLELLLPDALVPSQEPELPLLVWPPPPPPQRLTPRSVNPGAMRRSSFASSRFRCFIRYHLPPVARKCGPCRRPQQSGGPINAGEESAGWAVGPNLEADRQRVVRPETSVKASGLHPTTRTFIPRQTRLANGCRRPGRLRPRVPGPAARFSARWADARRRARGGVAPATPDPCPAPQPRGAPPGASARPRCA
jgi:hypothetical protein